MKAITNPLVWLYRIRHRCGYGVHSPFAFRFITEVIYEKTPFYSYDELDAQLTLMQRMRIRKGLHLLFRISNYKQPNVIVAPREVGLQRHYLQAGCHSAALLDHFPEEKADLIFLPQPNDEVASHVGSDTIVILDNLHKHREWFRNLPAVVTFDLYDVGIAFFDPKYNRQDYIVNF